MRRAIERAARRAQKFKNHASRARTRPGVCFRLKYCQAFILSQFRTKRRGSRAQMMLLSSGFRNRARAEIDRPVAEPNDQSQVALLHKMGRRSSGAAVTGHHAERTARGIRWKLYNNTPATNIEIASVARAKQQQR
jgi:hypothetical protein